MLLPIFLPLFGDGLVTWTQLLAAKISKLSSICPQTGISVAGIVHNDLYDLSLLERAAL